MINTGKKKVKIGENAPHPLYVPKDMVDDGFVGDVVILPNAVTATIIRPKTKLVDVVKSLERTLEDVKHRLELGMELFDDDDEEKKKQE